MKLQMQTSTSRTPYPQDDVMGKKFPYASLSVAKLKLTFWKIKKTKIFKFKDNDIYINEHLSPEHRKIFGEASAKRKELNYKYIWTNNGISFMRKDDNSQMIIIDSLEALYNLV